jgi:ATP-dependent DNA helicase RecQ
MADASVDAQMFLSALVRAGGGFGEGHLIEIVTGKASQRVCDLEHDKLKTFGVGKGQDEAHWRQIAEELLRQGHVHRGEKDALHLTAKGKEVLFGRQSFHRLTPQEVEVSPKGKKSARELPEFDPAIFEALRSVRLTLAREENVPPFVVASDRTLQEMAQRRPRNLREMAPISGIGQAKLDRYGGRFLKVIARYSRSDAGGDDAPSAPTPPRKPRPKKSSAAGRSAAITRELLGRQSQPEQVARHRGMALSTIVTHMESLILAGEEVDITSLIKPSQQEQLERLFELCGTGSLAKVLQACSKAFTYEQARLVRAKMLVRGKRKPEARSR